MVTSSTDLTGHSQEIINCGDIINRSYRTQPGNHQLWWYHQPILPDTARKSSIVVISSTDLTGHSQEIVNCGDIINRSYQTQPGNHQLWWYHQPILLDRARKSSIVVISSTDLTGHSQEIINCGDTINRSYQTQPGNRQMWWYHQPILPDTAKKSSIVVISSTDLTGNSKEIINCGDIINRSYWKLPENRQLWWHHQPILPNTARKSSIVVISSTDLTRHSQEIINCGDIINRSYRTQPGNRQLWWYHQPILPDTARKSSIVVISPTDLTGQSQDIINCGDMINRSYRTQPGNHQLWWYDQLILPDTARKSSNVVISSTDLTGHSQEIVNCGDIINRSYRTQPRNRQLWWYHQPILPDTARKSSIVVISSTDLTGHSQEIVNCGDIINRSYRTQPGNHQLWWYHQPILPDTARKSSIVVISSTDLTRHSQEIINCGDIINRSYRTQPGNRQLWWYHQPILPDTARKSSIVVISSTNLTGHSQEIINCGDIINRSYRTQPGNRQLWWYHQPILPDTARKSSIVVISSTASVRILTWFSQAALKASMFSDVTWEHNIEAHEQGCDIYVLFVQMRRFLVNFDYYYFNFRFYKFMLK